MPPVDDGPDFRKFLFEYEWNGHSWCFMLRARSTEEAKDRFTHLAQARYSGVIGKEITVPSAVAIPTGLLVRLMVWWKNFRSVKIPLSIKKS